MVLHSRRNGPVDGPDFFERGSGSLILQPYDPNSTHWKCYSRLIISSEVKGWKVGPHTGAMEAMIKEAKESSRPGFDYFHSSRCRILISMFLQVLFA